MRRFTVVADLDVAKWRPRLRESLVIERDGNELLVISTADRRAKRFTASETILRLIPLLNGTRTAAELVESLCGGSEERASEVAVLRAERLLSLTASADEGPTQLAPEQVQRYHRQLCMFQDMCDSGLLAGQTGLAVQDRLRSATVVIVGAGGLGTVVATSLAAAGTGTLVVCDDDVVEESNLTRQFAYSLDDIGRSKVDALAARLGRLNPDVTLRPEKRSVLAPADLADLAATADLVISCADKPSTLAVADVVTEACWPGTPHYIGGSYSYHAGLLGFLVVPGVTACWHCVYAEFISRHGRDRTVSFVPKAEYAGIVGAQSGIIGNMMAWESIRFLIGMTPTVSSEHVEFNYETMSFSRAPVPRHADCTWCAGYPDGVRRPYPRSK
jgi:molybdopterin/thiamine biosynthesis adenylyltransferase